MQQENGLDLLPALRADGRNIDVIMMTSAADTLTLQTALHYGVVDYLIKPFQFPRFEEALQAWRKKREISRVSCRKYLIWLEQINVLFTTNHYGITGRPEYRYRLVVENLMLLTQYSQ